MKDHIVRNITSLKKKKNKPIYSYHYYTPNGRLISDMNVINLYIQGVYIPPAYDNVIIYRSKKNDVLAIGEDSKGRKQYIYNKQYKELSKKYKFCDLIEFGNKYQSMYRSILRDIKQEDNEKNKLISIILKLIIDCNFRIGNDKYTKDNNSFGVTTLKNKHIHVDYNDIYIDFIGKKGVRNVCCVKDKKIKTFLKKRKKTHKKIFSYKKKSIKSIDVNNYLKQFGDFSSKNFRTWGANLEFIKELLHMDMIDQSTINKNVNNAIDSVSKKLHHTKTVCKNNYIDPKLVDFYKNHTKEFIQMFNSSKNNNSLSIQFTKFLKKHYGE